MSGLQPCEILVVDDNPGDVRLIQESLKDGRVPNRIHAARDGEEALAFLRRQAPFESAPRPDLILLDLNMPKVGGLEVLRAIKASPEWKTIPTVILTTSMGNGDIKGCYEAQANAYLVKPTDLGTFSEMLSSIQSFWLTLATLPVG
ncbi:MAG: response regulator [Acidobacteria bacterium]|nr:response regulator [Acidobacteriota bacterium]